MYSLAIVPLDMGIAGAALATGIGYAIPGAIGIVFFFGNRRGALYFTRPRFRLRVVSESCFNGSSLIHIFTGRGTEVYNIALDGFLIFRYSFLLCGFNIFITALFTALSNGLVSAAISFSRTFLFIMISLQVLPVHFGVTGVWVAIPFSEVLTFTLSASLFIRYRRRYRYW